MLTIKQIDNRTEWVDALRSFRYKQGRSALKYLNAEQEQLFCCLGVGCDIMINADKWKLPSNNNRYTINGECGYMPDPIAAEFGLEKWQQRTLTRMNDTGATFNHIAEVIDSWTKLETQ